MPGTEKDVYKGWEIALICERSPSGIRSTNKRIRAFAYLRRENIAEHRSWAGPWLIPKRGVLYYDSEDAAFAALRAEARRQIDDLQKTIDK